MNNCCRYSVYGGNITNPINLDNTLNSNNNLSNLSNQNMINNCEVSCGNENFTNALCNLIGRKCNCEFSTARGLESKCGILERVGSDFIVLRSVNNNRPMYCSLCDLVFITIVC